MDLVLTGTILSALQVFMGIPSFALNVSNLYSKYQKLSKKDREPIALKGPLGKFVEREKNKFEKIMDKYHEIDENDEYDEIEKDNYRKRIAAQLCKILKLLEKKKDEIEEYETLVEMFCKIIPQQ